LGSAHQALQLALCTTDTHIAQLLSPTGVALLAMNIMHRHNSSTSHRHLVLDNMHNANRRGPSTFERSVAAHRLLAAATLLRHPFLSEAVPLLLPPLLSAFSDPSPLVQACAAHALTHLTRHATAASLFCQRDILTHAVSRSLTGCGAELWPAVLPCALALAQRLDSVDGGAERQLAAIEARRGGHSAAVRRPFLRCLCASEGAQAARGVLAGVGIRIVAMFKDLLPALLDWMRLEDADGLDLICLVRSACMYRTWPMPGACWRGHTASEHLGKHADLMSRSVALVCKLHLSRHRSLMIWLLHTAACLQVLQRIWEVASLRMRAHAHVLQAEVNSNVTRLESASSLPSAAAPAREDQTAGVNCKMEHVIALQQLLA
jgi:hypothetical protein